MYTIKVNTNKLTLHMNLNENFIRDLVVEEKILGLTHYQALTGNFLYYRAEFSQAEQMTGISQSGSLYLFLTLMLLSLIIIRNDVYFSSTYYFYDTLTKVNLRIMVSVQIVAQNEKCSKVSSIGYISISISRTRTLTALKYIFTKMKHNYVEIINHFFVIIIIVITAFIRISK